MQILFKPINGIASTLFPFIIIYFLKFLSQKEHVFKCIKVKLHTRTHMQGVLLPDRQTLRDDCRHEDKHY